jgi:hypothetical protein
MLAIGLGKDLRDRSSTGRRVGWRVFFATYANVHVPNYLVKRHIYTFGAD